MYAIWEAYPWRFGVYCYAKTLVTEMTATASVFIITAFTFERYFAICYPLRMRQCGEQRAQLIIGMLWVLAFLTVLPTVWNTDIFYTVKVGDSSWNASNCSQYSWNETTTRNLSTFAGDFEAGNMTMRMQGCPMQEMRVLEDSLICSVPTENMQHMLLVFQLSTIFLFVVPVCVIIVLYFQIVLELVKEQHMARQNSRETHAYNNNKNTICMLGKPMIGPTQYRPTPSLSPTHTPTEV